MMFFNAFNSPWTDERVALLLTLWESKISCDLISGELNRQTGSTFTRNAVIGRANRMGLPKRKVEPRQRKTGPRKPRNRRITRKGIVIDLFADALPPPDFLGIPWGDAVDSKTCMYPEGDGVHMLFCGQPRKDESSYCPGHHAICHQKPTGPTTRYWKTWGRAA